MSIELRADLPNYPAGAPESAVHLAPHEVVSVLTAWFQSKIAHHLAEVPPAKIDSIGYEFRTEIGIKAGAETITSIYYLQCFEALHSGSPGGPPDTPESHNEILASWFRDRIAAAMNDLEFGLREHDIISYTFKELQDGGSVEFIQRRVDAILEAAKPVVDLSEERGRLAVGSLLTAVVQDGILPEPPAVE